MTSFLFSRQEGQRKNHFEVRFKTSAPDGVLLLQTGGEDVTSDYISLALSGGHLELSYNLGKQGPGNLHVIRSAVHVADGNWHNVIVTFSGQASTYEALKVYIDGNYVGFSQSRGTDVTFDEFTVGVLRKDDGDDTEQFFIGNIAQISMWTSALSPANAAAVYALGNSMDTRLLTPAPIHLYRFGDGDDNGPGTLTDYGSGDKDGTGEGDPTIVTDSPP